MQLHCKGRPTVGALTLVCLSAAFAAAQTPPRLGPVMDARVITAGLASHDCALYSKSDWIRDPYIVPGLDHYFYLTGTTPLPNAPREQIDP